MSVMGIVTELPAFNQELHQIGVIVFVVVSFSIMAVISIDFIYIAITAHKQTCISRYDECDATYSAPNSQNNLAGNLFDQINE